MPLFTVFQPCLSHSELLQDTIYNIRYMNITFTNKSLPLHGYWYPCILLRTQKYQRTPKLTSVMRPGHQELHVGNDTHTLFSVPSDDPMLSLRGPIIVFFHCFGRSSHICAACTITPLPGCITPFSL